MPHYRRSLSVAIVDAQSFDVDASFSTSINGSIKLFQINYRIVFINLCKLWKARETLLLFFLWTLAGHAFKFIIIELCHESQATFLFFRFYYLLCRLKMMDYLLCRGFKSSFTTRKGSLYLLFNVIYNEVTSNWNVTHQISLAVLQCGHYLPFSKGFTEIWVLPRIVAACPL